MRIDASDVIAEFCFLVGLILMIIGIVLLTGGGTGLAIGLAGAAAFLLGVL